MVWRHCFRFRVAVFTTLYYLTSSTKNKVHITGFTTKPSNNINTLSDPHIYNINKVYIGKCEELHTKQMRLRKIQYYFLLLLSPKALSTPFSLSTAVVFFITVISRFETIDCFVGLTLLQKKIHGLWTLILNSVWYIACSIRVRGNVLFCWRVMYSTGSSYALQFWIVKYLFIPSFANCVYAFTATPCSV